MSSLSHGTRPEPGADEPWDPRCGLVLALFCLGAVVSCHRVSFPLLVASFVTVWTLLSGQALGRFVRRLSLPLGVVAVLAVVYGLFVGTTPLYLFSLWGATLTLHQEGLRHAGVLAARVLAAACILSWLMATVPTHRLFAALRALRVPTSWLEMAIGVHGQLRDLSSAAREIAAAQRLRLGYDGWRRSFASAQNLAGAVLLRALSAAERRQEAMHLRGYSGDLARESLAVERLPALSWARRGGLVAGCVAIVALSRVLEHMPW